FHPGNATAADEPQGDLAATPRDRRRPHLCGMDRELRHRAARRRKAGGGHGPERLPGRLQCPERAFFQAGLIRSREVAMPLSLQTFSSTQDANAALKVAGTRYLGGGTLVMRAANEGNLSFSTLVRATDPALE